MTVNRNNVYYASLILSNCKTQRYARPDLCDEAVQLSRADRTQAILVLPVDGGCVVPVELEDLEVLVAANPTPAGGAALRDILLLLITLLRIVARQALAR